MSWPLVGPQTDVGKSHKKIKQNTNKIHCHFQQSQTLSSSIQSPYRLQCFSLLKRNSGFSTSLAQMKEH